MNTLESHSTINPYDKTDECAMFVIDDTSFPFVLSDIMTIGREYTFSLWLKSDVVGSLIVSNTSFPSSAEWAKYDVTFTAGSADLPLTFGTAGTYYVYHPKLEIGNKATDWAPAPEDVATDVSNAQTSANEAQSAADAAESRITTLETTIRQLADSIAMLVRDGNGGSLIKQDSEGFYYFDISDIDNSLSDTADALDDLTGIVLDANGKIDVLESTAEALRKRTEYVWSYTDDNDQPCLELGEGDSKFKVYITNTDIQFADDTSIPTRINRQMLIIEKAMVRNELQFGDDEDEELSGVFIWKLRKNGNLGLTWKGV